MPRRNSRVRAWRWNQEKNYIRFTPNPGIQWGNMHWSRHGGWRNRKREAK